jgi:signal transduction histidine kinase
VLRRWLRTAAGLVVGAGTAVGHVGYLVGAGLCLLPVLAFPRARRAVRRPLDAGARRLAAAELRRLARFTDGFGPPPSPGPAERALPYLVARWPLGLLGALVLLSVLIGVLYGSALVWAWWALAPVEEPIAFVTSCVGGLFLLFLAAQAVFSVADLEVRLARRTLGPGEQEALRRRIEELASSRAGVVAAVHDERRRIERDLHDGVQQRLVALGMLLGRARRAANADPAGAGQGRELLAQAHEQARQALTELREVAWRIYPTALDEAGLHAALETVVERSGLPVRLDYRLAARPATDVAAVAYFVVCEAVTNAVKHSGARAVSVCLAEDGPAPDPDHEPGRATARTLTVRVRDDGAGGADPAGAGLLGLARRAAALDGRLLVDSPTGGPTTITAELPCA